MIVNEGQFVARFDLNGKGDFINQDNLKDFTYSRDCGGGLPIFTLEFSTNNSSLLKYLNEGNFLNVSYGRDIKRTKNTKLRIYGDPKLEKLGNDKYSIEISGLLDVPNYFSNSQNFITKKVSGLELLQERGKALGFAIDKNNIAKSEDLQSWFKFNQSYRKFFSELLLHSYLEKSFPVMAITGNKQLRVYDFVKHIKKGPKFKLTQNVTKPSDILYNTDYEILKDKSDLINFWVGYLANQPVIDLLEGGLIEYTEDIKNILAISKNITRHSKEEARREETQFTNENTHKNYYRAYQKNLKHSIMFSRSRLGVDFTNIYRDIEPLDVVYFEDGKVESQDILNSFVSGNYMCTRVVENIQAKQLNTYVELCKENFNNSSGDIK